MSSRVQAPGRQDGGDGGSEKSRHGDTEGHGADSDGRHTSRLPLHDLVPATLSSFRSFRAQRHQGIDARRAQRRQLAREERDDRQPADDEGVGHRV